MVERYQCGGNLLRRRTIVSRKHFASSQDRPKSRRALEKADPAATRITDIATEFDFWEFGRFAVAYKSAFGESPSTTLRKDCESSRSLRAVDQ
jgi:AraC-like DNA-binding protein